MRRYDWEDALIEAQRLGTISNGGLMVALKLAKAIHWGKGGQRSELRWKNDDAFDSVGLGRATYYKHQKSLLETGFIEVIAGNIVPRLPDESTVETFITNIDEEPESTKETEESTGETKESTVETEKSTGHNTYSVDTYSEDTYSVDTYSEDVASEDATQVEHDEEKVPRESSPNDDTERSEVPQALPTSSPNDDSVQDSAESTVETLVSSRMRAEIRSHLNIYGPQDLSDEEKAEVLRLAFQTSFRPDLMDEGDVGSRVGNALSKYFSAINVKTKGAQNI